MEKTYQPHHVESKWAAQWETGDYCQPKGSGIPYCIMIPPPNVTGTLHMGHAFQDTLMDILIRYHRMQGDNTLWQMGMDHAGIATQMVVERQLLQQGIARETLGRDAFISKVWEWKAQSGGTIAAQIKRLGASVDWSTERFTMDEGLSSAVQEAFIRLYEEGLIYRGQRLVNWDPKLKTAVSDLEVTTEAEEGFLWHLRYPFVDDPTRYLVVATTRPETLFGDMAVAVHPEDPRYRAHIGKHLRIPLSYRTIAIIADDFVASDFGSGCVKVTPAHDFTDFEVGKRHQLPLLNTMTKAACLNDEVPPAYRGLNRFAARQKILEDLKALGLLEKTEKHTSNIPRGDKTEEILEPYLTHQWFVHAKPLAEKALEVVEQGHIRFVPEHWKKTYYEWLHNIQDWCISRQLWWGHRIPVWYDTERRPYVGKTEADVRCKYQLPETLLLEQETDVLDTWFSSALWPFSTLGWPLQTERLHQFYPSQVLVTGFDIIFFWVARMVMFGLKFTGKIPFHTVLVHGLILDAEGQKMSKSKGNTLDPIDLIDGTTLEALLEKRTKGLMQPSMAARIEKITRQQFPHGIPAYGTDALRFTLCALATQGRFIRFDTSRLEGYRHFCNKLWNATRFVLLQLENKSSGTSTKRSIADRWILSVLQKTIGQTHQYLTDYRFDLFAQTMYDFVWNVYCDWYLEYAKLQTGPATRATLVEVLGSILKLLHPIIPFMTEEIFEKLKPLLGCSGLLMTQAYPSVDPTLEDPEATGIIEWLQGIVLAIRNLRGEAGIAPSQKIHLMIQHLSLKQAETLQEHAALWKTLAKVDTHTVIPDTQTLPPALSTLYQEILITLPLEGNVDLKAERLRLEKEKKRYETEYLKLEQKLSQESFIQRAPEKVVLENKQRLEELRLSLERLNSQVEKLKT